MAPVSPGFSLLFKFRDSGRNWSPRWAGDGCHNVAARLLLPALQTHPGGRLMRGQAHPSSPNTSFDYVTLSVFCFFSPLFRRIWTFRRKVQSPTDEGSVGAAAKPKLTIRAEDTVGSGERHTERTFPSRRQQSPTMCRMEADAMSSCKRCVLQCEWVGVVIFPAPRHL